MYLNYGLTEDFTSIQKTIGILKVIDFRLKQGKFSSKGFEPGSDSRSCSVIVRVRVVLKRTVVGDSDNSPLQDYPHPDDHTTRSR